MSDEVSVMSKPHFKISEYLNIPISQYPKPDKPEPKR
jgi:hypothetical protein